MCVSDQNNYLHKINGKNKKNGEIDVIPGISARICQFGGVQWTMFSENGPCLIEVAL